MCGICGTLSLDLGAADRRAAEAMSAALVHRGPDDAGLHVDGAAALGFRRLSILDLGGGHQPMLSEDGLVAVVFNGEIYNHPALKARLEADGVVYRTRSDTETILQLYLREGARCVSRLEGMFAFAVWDARERRLLLARDRLGIKPLYYSVEGGRLAFASELRALARAGISREPDPLAFWDYLNYGYVHAPRTMLASARRLPPGHCLVADASGVTVRRYYALPGENGGAPQDWDGGDPLAELERRLSAAVKSHLLSDVPVGAFLSGGLDSSLIVALMARELPKVRTFTIGFSGARGGVDESAWARKVARRLGTDHHELILPADVLDRVEDLAACLDEPLADSALLPTYLLSRFARESVKVVLTGEGADELFAGYDRYKAAYVSELIEALPEPFRPAAAGLARGLGRGRAFSRVPLRGASDWAEATRHGRAAEMKSYLSPRALEAVDAPWNEWIGALPGLKGLNGALAADLRTVLAECLLMKVDKAGMRASLEARVPFLDRSVVELALSLGAGEKIRFFKGKALLRRLARRHLPADVVWRRKHGFVVPWEDWVRRSPAIEAALRSDALRACGLVETDLALKSLADLREGSPHVDAGLLFRFAVFALWLDGLK